MKTLKLKLFEHKYKVGQMPLVQPNLTTDHIFTDENNQIVGFYLTNLSSKYKEAGYLLNKANELFLSADVPKSNMRRSSGLINKELDVIQYSTILGGVPAKPVFKRDYKSVSSVHYSEKAKEFIKIMLALSKASCEILKTVMPEQHEKQLKLLSFVESKFRFGDLFTSAICNFNIAAKMHRDTGNIKETVNMIYNKKYRCSGGNLFIPDYNLCLESSNDSLIVYPAWKSLHGVTPIINKQGRSYRNSFIFYPLKGML